jgi:hypothetical protein
VLSRRALLVALAGAPLSACKTAEAPQLAAEADLTNSFAVLPGEPEKLSAIELSRGRPELARSLVPYKGPERPGTVIVRTNERKLYLVMGDGKAIRYPVGVGRAGKQWQGRAAVEGKHVDPAWAPPDEVRRDNPRLPDVIPGGSPRNPMGPRADAVRRRAIRHPRHEPPALDRELRDIWLHPHVQRGHHRPVRSGERRHRGAGDALNGGSNPISARRAAESHSGTTIL